MRLILIGGLLGLVTFIGGSADAGIITASTSESDWDAAPIQDLLDDIDLTLDGLAARIDSDLAITFRLRADLDADNEFVTLSVDGISLGNWLNENLFDDSIADAVSDDGGDFRNQSRVIFEGTATLSQAQAQSILADGFLVATFDFSDEVNDLAPPTLNGFEQPEFAEFSISYNATNSTVPEPSSMMIALSACGLAFLRRRKRTPDSKGRRSSFDQSKSDE